MSALRTFLSWPAGASLLYLTSAACLLGGSAWVLAPGAGDEGRVLERFAMLGMVALYVGSLAGLAALVCRWKSGNDDAVSLLTLLALFVPGMHAGLIPLAASFPYLALGLGLSGAFYAAVLAQVIARRVTGLWQVQIGVPLALITGWNALSPGLLAIVHQHFSGTEPLALVWLPGWGLVLACSAWIAGAVVHGLDLKTGDDVPIVKKPAFRVLLAATMLLATAGYQGLLQYGFDLGVTVWAQCGVVVALMIIGLAAGYVTQVMSLATGAKWATILGVVLTIIAATGWADVRPTGWWLVGYPPLMIALGSVGLAAVGWRAWSAHRTTEENSAPSKSAGMDCVIVAVVWALGAVLTWTNADHRPELNFRAFGISLAIIASVIVAIPMAVIARPAVVLASIALIIGGSCWSTWWVPTAVLLIFTSRAVIRRQRWIIVPGTIPLAVHVVPLVPTLLAGLMGWIGWLAVLGAFALLAVGGWTSWKRAQLTLSPSTDPQAFIE